MNTGELSVSQRSQARGEWLISVINRFRAASDSTISAERVAYFKRELDMCEYSERQARTAETWILRGDPARYKRICLPDFFPTESQLEQVGITVDAIYQRGYRSGWRDGYDAGMVQGIKESETLKERKKE